MRKLTTILACAMLTMSMAACGINFEGFNSKRVTASKNYVTKQFNLSDFNKISMAGSMDVYFTQRPGNPEVSVVTSDNIVDLLDVYVEDNTLYIKFKKGYTIIKRDKLDFTIGAADLNKMSLAGSGDFKLMNGLTTEDLNMSIAGSGDILCDNINSTGNVKLSISGSGDIESKSILCKELTTSIAGSADIKVLGIDAHAVKANISGSGDFKLDGKTKSASYSIAGSGDIDADELIAEDVTAHISGSGEITCYASESIKATRSGSGEIGYKGNPTTVDVSKKGVHPIN